MDMGSSSAAMNVDPVCGMNVDPLTAKDHRVHGGDNFYFCSIGCATRFDDDPDRFLAPEATPEGMPSGPIGVSLSKKKPRSSPTEDSSSL